MEPAARRTCRRTGIAWPLVLIAFLLLVLSNAGIGLAGASLIFLLEVKSGQDPITWAYRYLVMLASGAPKIDQVVWTPPAGEA